jgi:predicted NBD/HSP70 family sugar kinase
VIATYKKLCKAADQEPLTGEENMEHFIDQLKVRAHQNDHIAQQTFVETSVLLGMSLANVVNLLHPECIIFTGEGIASYDYMFESMLQTFHKHLFSHLGDHLHIIFEPWTGYESWARGAATLALRRFFSIPVQFSHSHS